LNRSTVLVKKLLTSTSALAPVMHKVQMNTIESDARILAS
jgi:hypothetical protein